jgi:hypothetical protein
VFDRAVVSLVLAVLLIPAAVVSRVWDIDRIMEAEGGLGKGGRTSSAAVVQSVLTKLEAGDALRLSRSVALGSVTIGDAAPDIEVFGGFDGTLKMTGKAERWSFVYACHDVDFIAEETADLDGCRFFCSFSGGSFIDRSSSTYEAIAPGFAPNLRKASVDSKPEAMAIAWGTGRIVHENYGDKVTWMPAYYVDGSGARYETETPQVLIKNATDGGKWLFAIEAEQGAHCPAVRVQDSERLQLYSGSTEGDNYQSGAIYYLENCREVVLGMRRFYSNHTGRGWSGAPLLSLSVSGEGNIIHNLVDIGNPQSVSLSSTDPSLQIWQTFFEDDIRIEAGTFQYMVTEQGMVDQVNMWTEPVSVAQEVVLERGGEDLVQAESPAIPVPPAFDFQPWMAKRPRALAKRAGRGQVARRFRESASFGAALLAAGADPTGASRSDAAFERVLRSDNVVEVPAGTFRLGKALAARVLAARGGAPGAGATVAILGAGPGKSVLVADPGVESVIDLSAPSTFLSKTGVPVRPAGVAVIDGIGIRGGDNGVYIPDGVSTIMSDFSIEGAAKACIVNASTEIRVPAEGRGCGDDENCADMHVYENGELSGSDYGIYYSAFADKQGIRNITFSGHSKAGIAAAKTNLFHGWIGDCEFRDINGPGVDLSGGHVMPPEYGSAYYTQWVTMIEGCRFIECGSSSRAAVDYGYTDINMLANCSITTTGKSIKYGFLGSVAEMSNVTIDVDAPVAIALRMCRATEGSRTPGQILHTVNTNGDPLLMVTDYPQGDGSGSNDPADDFAFSTRLAEGWDGWDIHVGRKWWKDGYEWAHTVLIYDSNIEGEEIGYELRNGSGFAKDLLSGGVHLGRGSLTAGNARARSDVWVYDLMGRRVARLPGRTPATLRGLHKNLPRGLYVTKQHGARPATLSPF